MVSKPEMWLTRQTPQCAHDPDQSAAASEMWRASEMNVLPWAAAGISALPPLTHRRNDGNIINFPSLNR